MIGWNGTIDDYAFDYLVLPRRDLGGRSLYPYLLGWGGIRSRWKLGLFRNRRNIGW